MGGGVLPNRVGIGGEEGQELCTPWEEVERGEASEGGVTVGWRRDMMREGQ
jgi:hypothetical protein